MSDPESAGQPTGDPPDLTALGRSIETEIIPRLLLAHRVGPISPAIGAAIGRELAPKDIDAFVAAVLGREEHAALNYVQGLIDAGVSVEAVYLDLLAPTARRLGALWEQDACDFVEVTVALGRVQSVLRRLSRMFIADGDGDGIKGRALLACLPGEQHTLGLFMVAEFFVRDGWSVNVGPPLSELDLLSLLRQDWYDVLGFSLSCDSHLPRVRREIRNVRAHSRNKHIRILVGGRMFVNQPDLVERIGADGSAVDARSAPEVAARLLGVREA